MHNPGSRILLALRTSHLVVGRVTASLKGQILREGEKETSERTFADFQLTYSDIDTGNNNW